MLDVLDVLAGDRRPDGFGLRGFSFPHDLVGRPELTLPALERTVGSIPTRWVLAHAAQRDPHAGRDRTPPAGSRSLPRLIREIGDADAAVRIYNLEHAPGWHELARAIEGRVRAFVGDREGGVDSVNLAVFVASPGAVTPAHPDRHHNLLLQIAGAKDAWVEDDPDARRHHLRVLDSLDAPARPLAELPVASLHAFEPGDGVYIPPYAFHWTRVGARPSVALSIGFSTRLTRHALDVVDFDRRLRRRGIRPRPAGPRSLTARAKGGLERAARACTTRIAPSTPALQTGSGGTP